MRSSESSNYKQKVEWRLSGAGGKGTGEMLFNEYRVSVLQMRRVKEVDGGDGCTTL